MCFRCDRSKGAGIPFLCKKKINFVNKIDFFLFMQVCKDVMMHFASVSARAHFILLSTFICLKTQTYYLLYLPHERSVRSLKQECGIRCHIFCILLPKDRGRFFLCHPGLWLGGLLCDLGSSLCCMGSRRLCRVSW